MKNKILQLKISLTGSKPLIWRRFFVKSNITFHLLHEIIQKVMGWGDYHLYEFTIDDVHITDEETIMEALDDEEELEDSAKTKLEKFVNEEKQKILYEYDFGDGWEHNIIVEKILPDTGKLKFPVCVDGKNACPPEDCGGLGGYYEFLDAIQNPNHPEHIQMLNWIGGKFDPEEFNLEFINLQLKNIKL